MCIWPAAAEDDDDHDDSGISEINFFINEQEELRTEVSTRCDGCLIGLAAIKHLN